MDELDVDMIALDLVEHGFARFPWPALDDDEIIAVLIRFMELAPDDD
jgi:hypothetical protein